MKLKLTKSELINDYGIPIFYDNRNGEMQITDTKKFFEGKTNLSKEVWRDQLIDIRREISKDKTFLCGCCKKPIYIAGNFEPSSGQKRLHFQHYHNDNNERSCKFYETGCRHSEDEIRRMTFNGQQESKKHKELKRIIADSFIHLVGRNNVFEEPTLHGKDKGWRRPDIFVKLPDKSIVFEVQLTYILLSAIIERNEVHRSNDRYVVWVFKDFGNGEGNTLDKERLSKLDIFIANNYNAFVLDDEAIERTIENKKLYLKVYYRDYYLSESQVCAKLGKELVTFDSLTFDEERKMVFFFDSQNKFNKCKEQLEEEKEKRFAEIEIQKREAEKESIKIEKRNYKEIGDNIRLLNQIFKTTLLSESDLNDIIDVLKEDNIKMQRLLDSIYNLTVQHRRGRWIDATSYLNAINLLTKLYYSNCASEDVKKCLRRCWENICDSTQQGNVPDLAVDLLVSPALPLLNTEFFKLISNPNHRLNDEQKNQIQDWLKNHYNRLKDYKNSNSSTYTNQDRYKHFYAWMLLLNNKVRLSNKMSLSEAHKLMSNNYKVIRAVISLYFYYLSGYSSKKYRYISDVITKIKDDYAEYAELFLRYAHPNIKRNWKNMLEDLSKNTRQEHNLDVLMKILFNSPEK